MRSMKFPALFLLLAFVAQAQQPAAPTLKVTTDRPDATYKAGETATFTIESSQPAEVTLVFSKDGVQPQPAKTVKLEGGTSASFIIDGRGRWLIPGLVDLDSTLKDDKPTVAIEVKRDAAADAGLNVNALAGTLRQAGFPVLGLWARDPAAASSSQSATTIAPRAKASGYSPRIAASLQDTRFAVSESSGSSPTRRAPCSARPRLAVQCTSTSPSTFSGSSRIARYSNP